MDDRISRLTGVFDFFEERVIAFHNDRVVYTNKAASQIFQDDPIGISLSSVIGSRYAKKLAAAGTLEIGMRFGKIPIEGYEYNIQSAFFDEILVLILIPASDEKTNIGFWTNHAITVISQEFRSPLNSLFSAINLLSSKIPSQDDEKISTYFAIMNQNCYKLLRLSNNIADLARFSENTAIFSPSYNDIVVFCKNLVTSVKPLALTKDVKIKFKSSIKSLNILFDPDKVERMLLNLISNSLKYTRDGNIITIKVTKSKENVFINIQDLGAGMSQDTLASIFKRFFSGDRIDARTSEPSFGLGLPLVHAIACLHNGTVAIESRENVGTSVTISLPITAESENYVRSSIQNYDYTGGFTHAFVELSDALPYYIYSVNGSLKK